MKRVKTIIPGIVFLLGLAVTEKVWAGIDVDVRVGDSARERERKMDVLVGEEFSIVLPLNETQGYVWQLEKTPGHEVRLINNIRCRPQDLNAGYCTEDRWTYQAVDDGKTTIKFRLVRPGDPDHPIDRVSYRIHVHD